MRILFIILAIVGTITILGFLCTCVYCLVNHFRYRKFQQNLKQGNKCKFYHNQQLYYGTISSFIEDFVVVVDKDGYPFSIYRSEVYPM